MDKDMTPFEALQKAVSDLGGQSAMARLCNVKQPSVWKWLQSAKRLPAEYVLPVEAETGISRHVLRPDIYPLEQRSLERVSADDMACSADDDGDQLAFGSILPPEPVDEQLEFAPIMSGREDQGQSNRSAISDERNAA